MKSKLVTVVALATATLCAAQETKKDYTPSELQSLHLQVKQRDAFIAQIQLSDAQNNFNTAFNALQSEATQIEKDNKWPTDLIFDSKALTFSEKPKPPAEPKEKK